MNVKVGNRVIEAFAGIDRYYGSLELDDVAARKVRELTAAIRKLGKAQIGHRTDDDLPVTYRRRVVDTYHIFYLADRESSTIYVYDVRHVARKPLKPETHRRRANQARRDNIDL